MSITGSQKAATYALFGVMRFGASRFGYHSGHAFISLAGVQIGKAYTAGRTLVDSLTITDVLDETPNTCSFTVMGTTPAVDDEVIITLGSTNNPTRLFAGHVLQAEQSYAGTKPSNIWHHVSAIDYSYLLGFAKVTKRYVNLSATAIVQDLITTYAAVNGFTVNHVVAGLETVDEITFTDEDLPTAITRLAKRIGGYWYVDYVKDLHFFLTETGLNPMDLTATHPTFSLIGKTDDGSQRVNRVHFEGHGSHASADVPLGDTVLPVDSLAYFNPAGGSVKSGPQTLTYTSTAAGGGVSRTGGIIPPLGAVTVAAPAGLGSLVEGATYRIGISYVTAVGDTPVGAISAPFVATASRLATTSNIPIPSDVAVTSKRMWQTRANGSVFYLAEGGMSIGTTTRVGHGVADQFLTYAASTTNSAGDGTQSAGVGTTSLAVQDSELFNAAGGVALAADQQIRYTGRSHATGVGNLTGISSSGVGSVTAEIQPGTTVQSVPALLGVPSSGVGSIAYQIATGDDVNLRVTVNDSAAQAALAARIGGNGVIEETLQDRRLSETEALARAQARLDQDSSTAASLRYRSRDLLTKAGKTVTVNLGAPTNISGAFKIQRATISEFDATGRQMPTFTVEASNSRYSFEDLLRRQRKSGA